MRKRRALTQPRPSDLEWRHATTTDPVERFEAEKGTAGPKGKTYSSRQEREQRGNFLTRTTSFFQSLWDSESEIQRRVNQMDKAGFLPSAPLILKLT